VEFHNTVFGSKRSAICTQAVYFLHSTMPSVTRLRLMPGLSAMLLIFIFQFSLPAFLPCPSARHHSGVRGLYNIGQRTLPEI